MTAFTRFVSEQVGRGFAEYRDLHRWSVENLEAFWRNFIHFTGLTYSGDLRVVLDSHKMPGARWFPGMQLNYAENLLLNDPDDIAVRFATEGFDSVTEIGYKTEYTFGELAFSVRQCAVALQEQGVTAGDCVAGYIANVPEAVIACLACGMIGAVWSSASPDFGLEALCDRFAQAAPKVIFASTHYRYGGRTFQTRDTVRALKPRLPGLDRVVSVPYPVGEGEISGDTTWQAFLAGGSQDIGFIRGPFERPLAILFSSGTTGAPKCLVHGTGGVLLQHRKELQLHSDLRARDALLFFTTCGWMMWNWQLSALSLGATICLYDGNPGYPDLTAIFELAERWRISHLGLSGRFLESCMKQMTPDQQRRLPEPSNLRALLYTGSPLSADGYRWVYSSLKSDLHLAGISGGTDIVSCFVLGNPNMPVYAGEIQCAGLAVEVAALDENGRSVEGEAGELVCRSPLPSMPLHFLNDPDGAKYRSAYFAAYPGVWCHGDYVEFTDTGVVIYGRSDATLNPGGVRIGSAEIYSALDSIPQIKGAVAVGWQPATEADEVIVLCVALTGDIILDASLQQTIRQAIRNQRSPRHVPKHIFAISEIPVTRSGKTVELSVKALLAGKEISNKNALANPQVLEEILAIRRELTQL